MPSVPTRAAFRCWLRSHEPCSEVGYAGFEEDCPLARWLRACRGRDVAVYPHESVWFVVTTGEAADEPIRRLPRWASHFGVQVDELMEPCASTRPVTASEALALLDWGGGHG
jgi:hypothetical protein